MSYIPKKALKKIQQVRGVVARSAATHDRERAKLALSIPTPRKLEVGVDSPQVCAAFDIYFNDKLQRLCVIADVEKGYIKRHVRGIGNRPVKNAAGKFDNEILFGRVQIVPKGQKRKSTSMAQQVYDIIAEAGEEDCTKA